ncbi:glycosyltransferase [Thermaerobacter sp. FW80]|uniref:sugar transferase n=1 Tax=Thermaerobacter sp. FW80 TaxID=2546351 RepID=UPI0010753865|nr:sugar transferase [Thermaerobacter sp. FW80]QBS37602.1 glycosyltransferase [Thermaerobacter sp. FW80]
MDPIWAGPAGTVALAGAHLALVAVALERTRRPLLTGFHVFLGLDAVAYGLRPLASVLIGGYLLYGLPADLHPGGAPVSFLPPAPVEPAAWAAYNRGLALQLGFAAALVAAYLLVRPVPPSVPGDAPARPVGSARSLGSRSPDGLPPARPSPARPSPAPRNRTGAQVARTAAHLRVAWLLSLLVGTGAVVAMHVLSDGAWLPGRRGGTTVTAAVPYGKILFPLAAIPLAASLPLAYAMTAGPNRGPTAGSAAGPAAGPTWSSAARPAAGPTAGPAADHGGYGGTGRRQASCPRAEGSRRWTAFGRVALAVGRATLRATPGVGTLWAIALLLLLYQRGYLLNAVVVAAWLDERRRPWTVRRLGALLVVLMVLLAGARPLAGVVAEGLVAILGGLPPALRALPAAALTDDPAAGAPGSRAPAGKASGAARSTNRPGPPDGPAAAAMPRCAAPWAARPTAPAAGAAGSNPAQGAVRAEAPAHPAAGEAAAPRASALRGAVPGALGAWVLGAARFVARTPDFDGPDVWVLVQGFTARHGLLGGQTLAAVPARLLPPDNRSRRCLLTAVDLLNTYRWRQFYWGTRFGFNVSLAQEVYLNFGAGALPVAGGVAGLLAALADRRLWSRRPAGLPTAREVYTAAPLLAAAGFTKEPAATLLWALAHLLVGAGVHAAAAGGVPPHSAGPPQREHPGQRGTAPSRRGPGAPLDPGDAPPDPRGAVVDPGGVEPAGAPGCAEPSSVRVVICRSNPVDPDPRVERIARTLARAGYRVTVVGWDREGRRATAQRATASATGAGSVAGNGPGPGSRTGPGVGRERGPARVGAGLAAGTVTGTAPGTATGTAPGTGTGVHKVLLATDLPVFGLRSQSRPRPPRSPYGNGLRNLPRWLAWQARLLAWLWRHRHGIDVIHACDFDTLIPALIVRSLAGGRHRLARAANQTGLAPPAARDGAARRDRSSDRTRIAVVYDIFDWYADTVRGLPPLLRRFVAALDRRLLTLADAVILADEHRRPQLGGARPRRLAVIHNSPDWDSPHWDGPRDPLPPQEPGPLQDAATPTDPTACRDATLPQDAPPPSDPAPRANGETRATRPAAGRLALRLAYVGTLQPGRGLDLVLSLMARHPEWHLELAGFGPDEPLVRQAAAALPNVTFHGRVAHDRCRQIYSRADVILALYDPAIPNHRYASPNRLFEALALGKPVVVARGTGVDRRVRRHRLGWVVAYGDSEGLEAALADAARWSAARRRAFARRVRRLFRRRWAWPHMERRLLALYRAVTRRAGGEPSEGGRPEGHLRPTGSGPGSAGDTPTHGTGLPRENPPSDGGADRAPGRPLATPHGEPDADRVPHAGGDSGAHRDRDHPGRHGLDPSDLPGKQDHTPPPRVPLVPPRGVPRGPRVLIGPKVPPGVRRRVLIWALGHGMAVDLIPDPYEVVVASARWSRLGDAPLLRIGPLEPPPLARLAKRILDVVGSLLLLVLFAWAFVLIPLLIWLDDRGPVLYRQTRLGLHGRPFTILKFRTMVVDAERDTGPTWAKKEDPRVTRIGRVLRSTHLDELPQLVNVLCGEMSLVGPRPERPELAARFSLDEPAFRLREAVKPGLTGLAQVER